MTRSTSTEWPSSRGKSCFFIASPAEKQVDFVTRKEPFHLEQRKFHDEEGAFLLGADTILLRGGSRFTTSGEDLLARNAPFRHEWEGFHHEEGAFSLRAGGISLRTRTLFSVGKRILHHGPWRLSSSRAAFSIAALEIRWARSIMVGFLPIRFCSTPARYLEICSK